MKNKNIISVFFLLFILTSKMGSLYSLGDEPGKSYNLFILKDNGEIAARRFDVPNELTKIDFRIQHFWEDNSALQLGISEKDFFQINQYGEMVEYGQSRLMPRLNFGWQIARSVSIGKNLQIVVLDGMGGIHPIYGEIPSLEDKEMYFGWDIARDVAWHPGNRGLVVLDGYGGTHRLGEVPDLKGPYFDNDIAISFKWNPDGESGYLLTKNGKLYKLDSQGYMEIDTDWEFDEGGARALAISPDGNYLFVLDCFGAVYTPNRFEPLSGPIWNEAGAMDLQVTYSGSEIPVIMDYAYPEILLTSPKPVTDLTQRELTVSLNIKNAVDLTGFRFALKYDPEQIMFVDHELSESVFDMESHKVSSINWLNADKGIVQFSCDRLGEPESTFNGENTLMKLKFTPLSPGFSKIKMLKFEYKTLTGITNFKKEQLPEFDFNIQKFIPEINFRFKLDEKPVKISSDFIIETVAELKIDENIIGGEFLFEYEPKHVKYLGTRINTPNNSDSIPIVVEERQGLEGTKIDVFYLGPSTRSLNNELEVITSWMIIDSSESNLDCNFLKAYTNNGVNELNIEKFLSLEE